MRKNRSPHHHRLFISQCLLQSSEKMCSLFSVARINLTNIFSGPDLSCKCAQDVQCHNLVSVFQRWFMSACQQFCMQMKFRITLFLISVFLCPPTPTLSFPSASLGWVINTVCWPYFRGSPDRRPNKALHFLPVWWVWKSPKGSEIALLGWRRRRRRRRCNFTSAGHKTRARILT